MDGESEVEGMSCHGSDVAARGSASCELLPPARDQGLRPCVMAAWMPEPGVFQASLSWTIELQTLRTETGLE